VIDFSTQYLGLSLANPLVASSSPLMENIDNIRRMEDSGAAAVVLHSLFEEQIQAESHALDLVLGAGAESFSEALTYLPELAHYNLGPEGYLEHVRRTKQAVQIPVIASLNGASLGGWVEYAKSIQEAGADALELNIYYLPTDPQVPGTVLEQQYCELVRQVKSKVQLPVAVKLSPYFTSMANMAVALEQAGANALVLFNRFYQPDFDLETLDVVPRLALSQSSELRLRLHWVALLYGEVHTDLAVTGGVHSAEDLLKAMMAGARVAMMTSALLENGIQHLARVLSDLAAWMKEHEYESIRQMQGSMAWVSVGNPGGFTRLNYMKVLSSYTLRG